LTPTSDGRSGEGAGDQMRIVGTWRISEIELWDQESIELLGPAFIQFGQTDRAGSGSSRSRDGWTAGTVTGMAASALSSPGRGRMTAIRPAGVAGLPWRGTARSGATSSSITLTTRHLARSAPQATPHDEQASTSMLAAPSSRHPGCAPSAAWSPGTREWSIALAESSVHSGKIFASAITFRSTSITSKSSGCAVYGGCRSSPAPGPALTSCTRLLRRRRRCADRRSSRPIPGPAGPSPPRGSQQQPPSSPAG